MYKSTSYFLLVLCAGFFQLLVSSYLLSCTQNSGVQYCLPKPLTGCPSCWTSKPFSNNKITITNHSRQLSLAGFHPESLSLKLFLCCKGNESWPKSGLDQYCIFTGQAPCPHDSKRGRISLRQLDKPLCTFCNFNHLLPSIRIPLDKSFYMMPYESNTCPRVEGAHAQLEYIEFSEEENGTLQYPFPYGMNKQPRRLNLCYYKITKKKPVTSSTLIIAMSSTVTIKTVMFIETSYSSEPQNITHTSTQFIPPQNVSETQRTISSTTAGSSIFSGITYTMLPWFSSSDTYSKMTSRYLSLYYSHSQIKTTLLSSKTLITPSLSSSISFSPSDNRTHGGRTGEIKGSSAPMIIGASFAALFLVIVLGLVLCCCRRRKRESSNEVLGDIPLWTFVVRLFQGKKDDVTETSFARSSDPLLSSDGCQSSLGIPKSY